MKGKVIKKPLTKKQVEKIQDKDGFIKVVVPLSLPELCAGIDCLNDAVTEMILDYGSRDADGCSYNVYLNDISYYPVGTKGENVLVQVTAEVVYL